MAWRAVILGLTAPLVACAAAFVGAVTVGSLAHGFSPVRDGLAPPEQEDLVLRYLGWSSLTQGFLVAALVTVPWFFFWLKLPDQIGWRVLHSGKTLSLLILAFVFLWFFHSGEDLIFHHWSSHDADVAWFSQMKSRIAE